MLNCDFGSSSKVLQVQQATVEQNDRETLNKAFHCKANEMFQVWENDLEKLKSQSREIEIQLNNWEPAEFTCKEPVAMFDQLQKRFSQSDSRIIAHHSTELDEVSKQLSREIDELLREFVDEEIEDRLNNGTLKRRRNSSVDEST